MTVALPAVLGVDLGTSGLKALLVREDGGVVADSTIPLSLQNPVPGWSEQHPEAWWKALAAALRALDAAAPGWLERVESVGISGQMHGAVFVDSEGRVLRPAILWNDGRSTAECEEITATVGPERLIELTGNRALAGFQAPKVLWVRRHEPAVFRATTTLFLPKDYLNFRLTGSRSTEPSDASGTLLFNVANRRWSMDVLEDLDVAASLLPSVMPSSSIIGRVTAGAAHETGLREGTPVVCGGADNACAALGMGIVDEGDVVISVGTSGTVLAPSRRPRILPGAPLHTFCHVVDGMWYSMGVVLSAGASFRWLRDILTPASGRDGDPPTLSYETLTREADMIRPGSEGLIFLPYLAGERTPHPDTSARGAFVGLSVRHTRAHLSRAVLEGVSFALRDSFALLGEAGVSLNRVIVTGGGGRSTTWRQLLADVLQVPVAGANSDMGPAFGAAILAGWGIGFSPPTGGAGNLCAETLSEAQPDRSTAALYDSAYSLYRELYPALRPIFPKLQAIAR